jgi:hypothetical protein
MEEEGMDRKRKEWGIRRKMLIFGIVDILIFLIRNPKVRRANKAFI